MARRNSYCYCCCFYRPISELSTRGERQNKTTVIYRQKNTAGVSYYFAAFFNEGCVRPAVRNTIPTGCANKLVNNRKPRSLELYNNNYDNQTQFASVPRRNAPLSRKKGVWEGCIRRDLKAVIIFSRRPFFCRFRRTRS